MAAKKRPNPKGKETRSELASLAARVLRTGKASYVELMALAACVLAQSEPNRTK